MTDRRIKTDCRPRFSFRRCARALRADHEPDPDETGRGVLSVHGADPVRAVPCKTFRRVPDRFCVVPPWASRQRRASPTNLFRPVSSVFFPSSLLLSLPLSSSPSLSFLSFLFLFLFLSFLLFSLRPPLLFLFPPNSSAGRRPRSGEISCTSLTGAQAPQR